MESTIKAHNMLRRGDSVVVAVSGGADSVALLLLLSELTHYGLRLTVAHFNHGLRGEEAERDERFVEMLAARLGLPFELGRGDAARFAVEEGLTLEEAARELRYRFLRGLKNSLPADRIATAHTLDDNAETVIMRLIRGSGYRGLGGIPPVSEGGSLIRPLIDAPREMVLGYLEERGEAWVTDSTNLLPVYLRNRVRLELIPLLLGYNPGLRDALARSARLMRDVADFMEQAAREQMEDVFPPETHGVLGAGLVGLVRSCLNLHPALRREVLRGAIGRVKGGTRGIYARHVEAVDGLLAGERASGEVALPSELTVAKGYGLFAIAPAAELERSFYYEIHAPGVWSFPEVECEVFCERTSRFSEDPYAPTFERGRVGFPITVRSFSPGMRFHPLGMVGEKKLKSFFIDEKVPRFLRRRVPVFMSQGEVLWVGGMRVDDRFKLTSDDALVIRLKRPRLGGLIRTSF
ncbi:MAG: tRNA lysidine(34) synthetase TilS [Candidatus Caldarchaeum sp.]